MRYTPAPPALYVKNRERFTKFMKPKSLAVFVSNDILPTNADGTMKFVQNSDLLFLSGIDQEESTLVLFPDAFLPEHRAMLFVRETNEILARWEGEKLNKAQASALSGISTVYWQSEFESVFKNVMNQCERVYLNRNEHLRAKVEIQTREDRFAETVLREFPLHAYERSAPILHRLRSVKQTEELDLMRTSAQINTEAFARILTVLKPGVGEWELEAEFAHEYLRQKAEGFAYTPIIASGASACILHYIENHQVVADGDLVLFDVGCSYAHYASDVTRCFPANGRFTARQRAVYEAVLRVQKAAMELLRPGNQLHTYHAEVGKIMESELLGLGLIDRNDIAHQNPAWPAYKKYFMHGTSHYLGLDVHDVGLWTEKMEVGQVFTVEPGIYIPEEGLGIRIEDNIVIGAEHNENLTAAIPKEVDAIEERMN
ncbi:M24 family metallopeptidase [bacterium]|nr:M24 family metallopeptidase [bacterium]